MWSPWCSLTCLFDCRYFITQLNNIISAQCFELSVLNSWVANIMCWLFFYWLLFNLLKMNLTLQSCFIRLMILGEFKPYEKCHHMTNQFITTFHFKNASKLLTREDCIFWNKEFSITATLMQKFEWNSEVRSHFSMIKSTEYK